MTKEQKEKASMFKARIMVDDNWLYRAILAIYERQTSQEQNNKATLEDNGVGFNGVDAGILSSYAQFIQRTGFLTLKQKTVARKKIGKYANQLVLIAEKKI